MTSSKLQWIGLAVWGGIVAAGVVACGGGGGDGGSASGQGTMRFAMTDAPGCGLDHVWVTVEKVSVNQSATASDTDAGWTDLTLSPARRIDLLTLSNGVLEELGTVPLAAGHYSQVRLVLAANAAGANPPANAVQPTGGVVTALSTPSGQQSGLKLQVNADVASGQMADLVLDFDACRSVVKAGNSGQYLLKPVISVVPRVVTGIQGVVTSTLTLSSTTISAQQNGAVVRSTMPDSSGNFAIPFLAAGTYTLVITSDAHATGVVTSVPAGSTTTVVGTTAAPIVLPSSSMADVTGTVTASVLSGGTTVTAPVTDARLRALQTLTGGPVIEVASQSADATLGTYRFRLPQAAPVKAAYAGTATLTLSPDASVAGKYTIEASAPGRATLTKPADVSSSSAAQVNFGY
jgi:hypothetical protein